MDFSGDFGLWQRKVAECPEGMARRRAVFEAMAVESGQEILDLGYGGGQQVRECALAVGAGGRAVADGPWHQDHRKRHRYRNLFAGF